MKQKFHSLDLAALTTELQLLIGLRLQNVYDLSPKTFLLKFARPDHKHLLYIESGFRMHLTEFAREKQPDGSSSVSLPGGFCMKLRKHLRTKRLTALTQLGVDRRVDFQFGEGEATYHLICEFYASGNVVLTDAEYRILTLLRVVEAEGQRYAVGEIYDIQGAKPFQPLSEDRVHKALEGLAPKDQVRRALAMRLDYSAPMIEHCLLEAGYGATVKVSEFQNNPDKERELFEALRKGDDIFMEVVKKPSGVIVMERMAASSNKQQQGSSALIPDPDNPDFQLAYVDFHPYLFRQFQDSPVKTFPSLNSALDTYFSTIESQKLELRARAQEEQVHKKLANVRSEHEHRVHGLEQAQLTNERKAQLIELNLEQVDQAILVIRSAIASGMDWVSLKELVSEEQLKRNPVALIIAELKLETNQVTLLLREPDYSADFGFEDDSDAENEQSKQVEKVDVDIGLSAYANARRYYETKKQTAVKQKKTIQASEKAMKSAEQKILKEAQETKQTASITRLRKPFWFEKFNWFISSENYLVLGGRDAQQNEILVKRHLKKGDVYVHADLPGSASIVVKNHAASEAREIPPTTLMESAYMAIVNSRAWDAKIVTSAYWVHHDQVSKTAPSGEFLTTGSFMIRGKKNYLPPTQLVFGFGLLFRVADESIPRHFHERRPHLRGGGGAITETGDVLEVGSPVAGDNDQNGSDGESALVSPSVDAASMAPSSKESIEEQFEKYNLNELGEEDENESSVLDDILPRTKKGGGLKETDDGQKAKYVSAAERRKAKKGSTGQEDDDSSLQPKSKPKQSPPKKQQTPQPSQQKQQKAPRGKKGKLKKMKQKYADQDEEERKMRMKLLASSGKKADEESDTSGSDSDGNESRDNNGPVKEKKEIERPVGLLDQIPKQEIINPLMSNLKPHQPPRPGPSLPTKQTQKDDDEEVQQLLAEENIQSLDQDEIEDLSYLDSLTGQPSPEDIILFAIPVAAPYSTLQTYKYRVKLVPGGLKRGKASKEALYVFSKKAQQQASVQERDCIKSIPDQEAAQTMLAKVKVMTGPGESSKSAGGKKSRGRGKAKK